MGKKLPTTSVAFVTEISKMNTKKFHEKPVGKELYEGGAVVLKKKNCMKVVRWY